MKNNFLQIKKTLGNFIKYFLRKFLSHVNKKIHTYGPFKMDVNYFFFKFK